MHHTLYRVSVLPEQARVVPGGLSLPSQQSVRAGICNLFRVPAITCLLFMKDTEGSLTLKKNTTQMLADVPLGLMSFQLIVHTLMHLPTYTMLG